MNHRIKRHRHIRKSSTSLSKNRRRLLAKTRLEKRRIPRHSKHVSRGKAKFMVEKNILLLKKLQRDLSRY